MGTKVWRIEASPRAQTETIVLEEISAEPIVPKADIGVREPPSVRSPLLPRLLVFAVGLVAVAAIAASAWVYAETQRQMVQMATDIAQIRVSLELYGRQAGTTPAPVAAAEEDGRLLDLSNRLAILEESWRSQGASATPASPVAAPEAAAAAEGGDCVPAGTRFLVSSGDSYAICGSDAVIEVSQVESSHVSLSNGTIIPAGGTALLTGTSCSVAVMASGPEGLTGYADIRVSC